MPDIKDEKVNLHKGHRERVKKRYLKEGIDAFEDHQILELLLFYAIPLKDTNDLAHKLLRKYGSLHKLFEAPPAEIAKFPGMGEHSAILVNMISQLARVYMKDVANSKKKPVLGNTDAAGEYAVNLFIGRLYEALYVISLDRNCKLINCEIVSEGSNDETPFYSRRIVEMVLNHKADKVILAHNHPSGTLMPSNNDIYWTKELNTALKNVGIDLVDHFIVSGSDYLSMARRGFYDPNGVFYV